MKHFIVMTDSAQYLTICEGLNRQGWTLNFYMESNGVILMEFSIMVQEKERIAA